MNICKQDELTYFKNLFFFLSAGVILLTVGSVILFIQIKMQFNKLVTVHKIGNKSILGLFSRGNSNKPSKVWQVSNGATVRDINLNLAKFITNEDEENRNLEEFNREI